MPDVPVLRPARPADAAPLADVYLASRRTFLPTVPLVHDDDAVRRWVRDVVLPGSRVWVAEHGGGLVGFAALTPGWLDHLYLVPGHTGAGTGSRLVERAQADEPGGLELWAFQVNTRAIRFYERHGFEAVEWTDGAGNEERTPDVRMRWPGR